MAAEIWLQSWPCRFKVERLTPMELQIPGLMAEGVTNRIIEQKLLISEGAVKSHVRSIIEKLGVLSRTEKVALAAKRGQIQLG